MKGFSILEELIVIAIASILAAIAIPNFLNVVNNLTTTEAGQTLNNIGKDSGQKIGISERLVV